MKLTRFIPLVLGLAAFATVGYLVYWDMETSGARTVYALTDACYAQKGIDLDGPSTVPIPPEVQLECTQFSRDFRTEHLWRTFVSALIAAVAAALAVGALVLLLRLGDRRRRTQSDGGSPPHTT